MTYYFQQYYIPDRMMSSLERYIKEHIPPGDFLQAVICNDLSEACGRADEENMANLPAYCAYLYNEAPWDCWGNKEKMEGWLAKRNEKEVE